MRRLGSGDFVRVKLPRVDQVQMLSGNTAIALGHWTLQSPSSQGYWTEIYELQGQDWTMRLHAHNITLPAPPPK